MKEKDPAKISWKQMFLFTRNGNLQNTDLLYAFFISVIFLFVNFIIGNRLAFLVEGLLPEASRTLKNILDIIIPSLVSVLISCLLFRIMRKKKIPLMACGISLVIALAFLIGMIFMYDSQTKEVLILPMASIFVIPAAAATAAAALLYRRWCLRHPDPIKEEERELAARH